MHERSVVVFYDSAALVTFDVTDSDLDHSALVELYAKDYAFDRRRLSYTVVGKVPCPVVAQPSFEK